MRARENPFRSEKVADFRYQIEADTLADWREQITSVPSIRWAIMGPEGTGKSILLEDLAQMLPTVEWVRIKEDDSVRRKVKMAIRLFRPSHIPLFFDGAETLPRFIWSARYFFRSKIVATLHHPRKSFTVHYTTKFEPKVVISLVETLLQSKISQNEAERILQIGRRNNGNVREILRQLYLETSSENQSP